MVHELKILSKYYNAVCDGTKTFEVRKNDRNFNVGDLLRLRECAIEAETKNCVYSDWDVWVEVTYIYCMDGFDILAIKKTDKRE